MMTKIHTRTPRTYGGVPVDSAQNALVCIHGRGGKAADLIRFAEGLGLSGVCLVAPEADDSVWYPRPFMESRDLNEPYFSAARDSIDDTVSELYEYGFTPKTIHFLGFSQGACLSLDHCARATGKRWGGVFAFSGGLIGTDEEIGEHDGDLLGTPVFIGCSDVDPFIPKRRVERSAKIFEEMNARVELRIYPDMEHRINRDEAEYVKAFFS